MLKITSNAVPGLPRILKRITAAGLSRVLDHMWKGSFGILSAALVKDKEGNRVSDDENYIRNGKLKNVLKKLGHGWIDFSGGYMYQEKDAPDFPVKEDSLFLPDISESDLRALASKFDQESYIFGDKGYWKLQATDSEAIWGEGLIEDMFETFKEKEVGKDYPFMSQMGTDKGRQFRLDPQLVQRRKDEEEQLLRHQREHQHHIAFRLVGGKAPCFYSITGEFRPRPPVCIAASDVILNGSCPDGSLLDCWLPLREI